MQDGDVVAAIVAGGPEGIAEASDKSAMPLYSYCRSLLREPADAADAVQDTFLMATSKLGGLRDRGKLRSWLYEVARNECYRRLRSVQATSALDDAVDLTADAVDAAGAVEQAELRQLVQDALAGLNPGERDVIEPSLVQGLDGDELADALGVQGTLTLSLSRLVLVVVNGHAVGTFSLTAKGGPVRYSISGAAGLSVSPASGSLSSGASATITVTSSNLITLNEQLTVDPGGYTVTVVLNISV